MTPLNHLGQPVGAAVPGWKSPPPPERSPLPGRYGRLEPLTAAHAASLFDGFREDREGRGWSYLPYGPFATLEDFGAWIEASGPSLDPLFFAIVDAATGRALGIASFLNIRPRTGSIEVGHLHFGPRLQRTRLASEAMYLMMKAAFELGYRRYEWKCDACNQASRNAALRYGFSFEGVFRQHMVIKGRNRDTAWYAAIDREWPLLRRAYETWLDPGNFDREGRQKASLAAVTRPLLARSG